ncbi:MAG: sigma-70 family RNA polymerase sigma factor [Gemmatimonadota bacterium]
MFDAHFPKVFRVLDRLGGDPELAEDVAQEAFVRLYLRGSVPDRPEAWLVSVAMNLFRNARSQAARRRELLAGAPVVPGHGDPPAGPERRLEADLRRRRVRSALDRLSERDRKLLLLQAEGYRYRDIATVLGLNETSVGTLLSRARERFRAAYGERIDAR